MRWIEWLIARNEDPSEDDRDTRAEVTAAKIKAAEVRRAHKAAKDKMPEYEHDVDELVGRGVFNHFGESITLGMELRRQHGT